MAVEFRPRDNNPIASKPQRAERGNLLWGDELQIDNTDIGILRISSHEPWILPPHIYPTQRLGNALHLPMNGRCELTLVRIGPHTVKRRVTHNCKSLSAKGVRHQITLEVAVQFVVQDPLRVASYTNNPISHLEDILDDALISFIRSRTHDEVMDEHPEKLKEEIRSLIFGTRSATPQAVRDWTKSAPLRARDISGWEFGITDDPKSISIVDRIPDQMLEKQRRELEDKLRQAQAAFEIEQQKLKQDQDTQSKRLALVREATVGEAEQKRILDELEQARLDADHHRLLEKEQAETDRLVALKTLETQGRLVEAIIQTVSTTGPLPDGVNVLREIARSLGPASGKHSPPQALPSGSMSQLEIEQREIGRISDLTSISYQAETATGGIQRLVSVSFKFQGYVVHIQCAERENYPLTAPTVVIKPEGRPSQAEDLRVQWDSANERDLGKVVRDIKSEILGRQSVHIPGTGNGR